MLIQLHWQERLEPYRTIFVAQDECPDDGTQADAESALNRLVEVGKRRFNECPDGYAPMICTQDAKEFVSTNVHVILPDHVIDCMG